jgi:hypothetical protein
VGFEAAPFNAAAAAAVFKRLVCAELGTGAMQDMTITAAVML